MPYPGMGAVQDKLSCDPIAIEKAKESFSNLDTNVQQEIQKLTKDLESRELYKVLQMQVEKTESRQAAGLENKGGNDSLPATTEHSNGVVRNGVAACPKLQPSRNGGTEYSFRFTPTTTTCNDQNFNEYRPSSHSTMAAAAEPLATPSPSRAVKRSPSPDKICSERMAIAPKKRFLEAAGHRNRSSSFSTPSSGDHRCRTSSLSVSETQQQRTVAARTPTPQHIVPAPQKEQSCTMPSQTTASHHLHYVEKPIPTPHLRDDKVNISLKGPNTATTTTSRAATPQTSASSARQNSMRIVSHQQTSPPHSHTHASEANPLQNGPRMNDVQMPQASSKGQTHVADGKPKGYNIRTCVETIVESVLIRSTLTDDADSFRERTNSNASSKRSVEEDNNCPLQPHDIQQQMSQVLSSDIEQPSKKKQAHVDSAVHQDNLQHVVAHQVLVQLPHPVSDGSQSNWVKNPPSQLSLHDPRMIPMHITEGVRLPPPPLVQPDSSLVTPTCTVPYIPPPIQYSVPPPADIAPRASGHRLPPPQLPSRHSIAQLQSQTHPRQQQQVFEQTVRPDVAAPHGSMVSDMISQGHMVPRDMPIHIQGEMQRLMHFQQESHGIPMHLYPVPMVPGTAIRIPREHMVVEASVANAVTRSNHTTHPSFATPHPEGIFNRAPMPHRIAIVRPGTVIPEQQTPRASHVQNPRLDTTQQNQPRPNQPRPAMVNMSPSMTVSKATLPSPVGQQALPFPPQVPMVYGDHHQLQSVVHQPSMTEHGQVMKSLPVAGYRGPIRTPIPIGIAPPEQRRVLVHSQEISPSVVLDKNQPHHKNNGIAHMEAPLDLSVKATTPPSHPICSDEDGTSRTEYNQHIQGLQHAMQKHTEHTSQTMMQSRPAQNAGLAAQPKMQMSNAYDTALVNSHHLAPPPLIVRPASPGHDQLARQARSSSVPTPPVAGQQVSVEHRSISYESITAPNFLQEDAMSKQYDARSPSPTQSRSSSILGNHPLNDILFLKCGLCCSTYGSLHSFKKHFSKAHGGEPSKNDVTIQSISATRRQLQLDSQQGKQAALRDLNLLPSNIYYESQRSRYKTDGDPKYNEFAYNEKEEPGIVMPGPGQSFTHQLLQLPPPKEAQDDVKVPMVNAVKDENEHKSMQCLECGQDFPTRDWGVFRRHVKAHEQPGEGQLRCSVCRQCFQDENHYRLHVTSCHIMQLVKCKQCTGVTFSNQADLDKHMHMFHHMLPSMDCSCRQCIQGQNASIINSPAHLNKKTSTVSQLKTPHSKLEESSPVHVSMMGGMKANKITTPGTSTGGVQDILVTDYGHIRNNERKCSPMTDEYREKINESRLKFPTGHHLVGLGISQPIPNAVPPNLQYHATPQSHVISQVSRSIQPGLSVSTALLRTPNSASLQTTCQVAPSHHAHIPMTVPVDGTLKNIGNESHSRRQEHRSSTSDGFCPPVTAEPWGISKSSSQGTLEDHVHAQLHMHMQRDNLAHVPKARSIEVKPCAENHELSMTPRKNPPKNARVMLDEIVETVLIMDKGKSLKSDKDGKLAFALTGRLPMEYESVTPTSKPHVDVAIETTPKKKKVPTATLR